MACGELCGNGGSAEPLSRIRFDVELVLVRQLLAHLAHEGAPEHMLEQVGSTPQTIRELAMANPSAKTNVTVPFGNDAERVLGMQSMLYMALLEIHDAGFEYASS